MSGDKRQELVDGARSADQVLPLVFSDASADASPGDDSVCESAVSPGVLTEESVELSPQLPKQGAVPERDPKMRCESTVPVSPDGVEVTRELLSSRSGDELPPSCPEAEVEIDATSLEFLLRDADRCDGPEFLCARGTRFVEHEFVHLKRKASHATAYALSLAKNPKTQAVSASAAGGAVVVGAVGGAAGAVGGGVVGSVVGLSTAMFTLGLSIPVCTVLGSTVGAVGGSSVGAACGLVGGGATGYGVYSHKDTLRSGAAETWTKVHRLCGGME